VGGSPRNRGNFKGPNLYVYTHNNPVGRVDPLGLDSPRCDNIPAVLEGPCVLECCAQHDACYDRNGCTAGSWFRWGGECNPCGDCNGNVRKCFWNCKTTYDTDDPERPNCYDGKQHKFIWCGPSLGPPVPPCNGGPNCLAVR
jgi:hypothetical protein